MAYVRPDCPLPRNSINPPTACEAARSAAIVASIDTSVQNAYRASKQIAAPSSFSGFGQPVVDSAAYGQSRLANADLQALPASRVDFRSEIAGAPQVLPLNVSQSEYDTCCNRGTDALAPVQVSPSQYTLTMPPAAPVLDLARADGQPAMKYDAILSRPQTTYGMQGMGAVWGDASTLPCTGTWGPGRARQAGNGISGRAALLLGLAALGLFAVSRR